MAGNLSKNELRQLLRQRRRAFVESISPNYLALAFFRIPSPIIRSIEHVDVVGVYAPTRFEAPTQSYVLQLQEMGKTICLPYFEDISSPMSFRAWSPVDSLVKGPHGIAQPGGNAVSLTPDAVIVPLIGFDENCNRLGQGKGHYDKWLAANKTAISIGLAWSAQLTNELPVEAHDEPLDAVICETSIYARRPT